jgi:hypothetical protein
MQSHIRQWIRHLSEPQDNLGGLAVCPYAVKAKYQIIDRVRKPIDFELDKHLLDTLDVLLYLKEFRMTKSRLYELCDKLNATHREYVFLADHWDTETTIKDVRTNNGLYNLVLCQNRSKLEKARQCLRSTNYYDYWSKKYLKDVLST